MTSTTDLYMQLQEVYETKAKRDRAELAEIIDSMKQTVNSAQSYLFPEIDSDLIDRYCRNVFNLRTMSTRGLAPGCVSPSADAITDALTDIFDQDPKQTPILWYLTLIAVDRFFARAGRYPGTELTNSDIDCDSEAVWLELQKIADELSPCSVRVNETMDEDDFRPPTAKDLLIKDHAIEIVRVGACEMHNIAALIGGIAAQEIVKLITAQYVPINNLYVFNGITGVGATYEI
jgi:amyloid beta precursor protein binding protein 1